MSVISSHHFMLVRSRRELERAFSERDWEKIRQWDSELGRSLNLAFDDSERNTQALVDELEKILQTYAEVLACLPEAERHDNHFSP